MILRLAHQENDPANDPYWNDMRNHDYSKSFPAIKEFIHQNSPKMRNYKRKRNRIGWALAILLPLLVVFSCKRETYIEPQGATLSFIAKDSLESFLAFAIQKYGDDKWRVVMHSNDGTMFSTIYVPAESYDKLKEFAEKLKPNTGVAELYLSAVSTSLRESRFSRMSYKIFNQHVDAKGATDEQLSSEIEKKLKAIGVSNMKVQLVKEFGKKQVKLIPTGKGKDFTVDIKLQDGSNVSVIAKKILAIEK